MLIDVPIVYADSLHRRSGLDPVVISLAQLQHGPSGCLGLIVKVYCQYFASEACPGSRRMSTRAISVCIRAVLGYIKARDPFVSTSGEEENIPPPRRPSEGWLRNPAWIDGGVDPPRFYYTQEQINDDLVYWRPRTGPVPAPAGTSTRSPLGDRLDVHGAPDPQRFYRPHVLGARISPVTPTPMPAPASAPAPARAFAIATAPTAALTAVPALVPAAAPTSESMPAASDAASACTSMPGVAAERVSGAAVAPSDIVQSNNLTVAGALALSGSSSGNAGDQQAAVSALNPVHYVTIIIVWTEPATGKGRAAKAVPKNLVKPAHLVVLNSSRGGFIKAAFAVHDLADQYSPGALSGPGFKMWWSGSIGGKSGAATIDTDQDFATAKSALERKNKDCNVSVQFDLDNMQGFKIVHRPGPVAAIDSSDDELMYGTRVPRMDAFSEESQLHGKIVVQLKSKWPCDRHQGEHGEQGHCYIDTAGNHIGLNHRKLSIWASAIAANDCTKHEPPNNVAFDGVRDGRLTVSKARGRTGPRPRSASSPAKLDPTTALMTGALAAMLPLLTNTISASTSKSASSPPRTPVTIAQAPPSSPLHDGGDELYSCLDAFKATKGIDLFESKTVLDDLELTPDVIPSMPYIDLATLLGVSQGKALKFAKYCIEWSARHDAKRRRLD